MSSVDRQKYVLALKLPECLYSYFDKDPDLTGKVHFNLNTMALRIEVPLGTSNRISQKYIAALEPVNDTYIFSVDSGKKPRYKGKIASKGILLAKDSLENTMQKLTVKDTPKSSIAITEKYENFKGGKFKLHDMHELYTMGNTEQAINKMIRKDFSEKKKRSNKQAATNKLIELFRHQKYWKIANLSDETSEPVAFIREILKEIGTKSLTGEFRGLWSLR